MTYIGSLSGSTSSSTGAVSPGATGGISGLASGLNTDSIVQGLMQAADQPLIQLLQQRQITQWKQESYQRVNNSLTDLQSNLSSLQLQSTFLATSSSSTNSAEVSATSNTLSPTGSYSVGVTQLASGATVASANTLSTDSSYANTVLDKLSPNPLGLSSTSTTPINFTLNGQQFVVDPSTDTINSILQRITEDTSAGVSGFYDSNTGKVVLQTSGTGGSAKIDVSNDSSGIFTNLFGLASTDSASQPMTAHPAYTTVSGADNINAAGSVNINGAKFSVTNGESLSAIAAYITAQSAQTGVSASYSETQHQLSLTAVTTASQTLDFSSLPKAGDTLNVNGTQVSFYDSSQGQTAPSTGIGIDLNGLTSTSQIASSVASAIDGNPTLSAQLTATVTTDGSHVVLNANQAGAAGNFTTSYVPVGAQITVGTETPGTSSTPTTNTVTFGAVPAAGDTLSVAGQQIDFYDSSTGSAPSGSGVTAIDVHNQTAAGIATAVSSALTNATGTVSGDQITISAKTNGTASLNVNYAAGAGAITGTGVTNTSDSSLFSGISVINPNSFTDSATVLGIDSTNTEPASVQTSKDAYYSINGYNSSSETNQISFNNTSFTLNGVTPAGTPANVTVSPNTDSIVKTITDFVQQYNETLQYMQGQYNTVRDYGYQPLTSAQASQMTSQQVTEWNQKAQGGMLQNDSTLNGVMTNIKNIVSSIVPNQPTDMVNGQSTQLNSLSSLGISPIDPLNGLSSGATAPGVTTAGFNTYGLLQINTAQLQAAVQADPQAVMNLFTSSGTGPTDTSGDTGIAKQLYNSISSSIKTIQQQAGTGDAYDPTSASALANSTSTSSTTTDSSLLAYTLIDPTADLSTLFSEDSLNTSFTGTQINAFDTQANNMNTQLQALQARYQQQFSTMESAIQKIDSQSSYIVSMMGGGSSSSSTSGG